MQVKINSRLILSVIIVLLCSIVLGLLKYEMGQYFPLANYSLQFSRFMNNMNSFLTSLLVIIFYLLIVSIAHLMAIIFDGQLSVKNLLVHIGFGFSPLLIVSFLTYYFFHELFYKYAIISENQNNMLLVKSFIEKDNILQLIKSFNLFAQLFIFIWTIYGLRKIYQLSFIKAIMCLTIPGLLVFLFVLLFKF